MKLFSRFRSLLSGSDLVVAQDTEDKIRFLEQLIGESIDHPHLYLKALRHRSSLANSHSGYKESDSYEQLEFLGDAVLDLIVTEILFERFPQENEGFMTKLRSKVVKGSTLAKFSKKLKLSQVIEVGERVKGQGIEFSTSVLADIFEALIGAMYKDKGYKKTYNFVLTIIDRYIDLQRLVQTQDNFKSMLLEYAQAQRMSLPEYNVITETGPEHDKTFEVQVLVNGKKAGVGSGKNKKSAEQDAARSALKYLHALEN